MVTGDEELVLSGAVLKKFQQEMFALLVEFDRICQKHQIRYFLSCGTLLGAVRHQGFIPWDDDIDVEMLRADYERFCAVCAQEIDTENFFFQTHQTDPHYIWFYGKMRRQNTDFVRVGQRHLRQQGGICMDVFILDDICANDVLQHIHEIVCKGFRKMLWSCVGQYQAENAMLRLFYKVLARLPSGAVLHLFEKFARIYESDESRHVVFHNTWVRTKRGYAFRKEWYEKSLYMMFEGREFPVPAGYHEILYLKYNDYMQYPPPEKRLGTATATYIKFSDGEEIGQR